MNVPSLNKEITISAEDREVAKTIAEVVALVRQGWVDQSGQHGVAFLTSAQFNELLTKAVQGGYDLAIAALTKE